MRLFSSWAAMACAQVVRPELAGSPNSCVTLEELVVVNAFRRAQQAILARLFLVRDMA